MCELIPELSFDRIKGFLPAFGDGLKRNIIYSVCTPCRRGHVLPSRDRLPGAHDVGPDGTATAGESREMLGVTSKLG